MPNKMKTKDGTITITKDVIADIAGAATTECYGIVGMASQKIQDGLFQLIGSESMNKGIIVRTKNERITIDLYILVSYGTKISVVAQNIIENVRYKVETLTGVKIEKINVIVQGVRTID